MKNKIKDTFDIFFQKFSYKFPKGYVDINNKQDIILLENILSNILNENVTLMKENTKAIEAIDLLKSILNLKDSDFVKMSSIRYKLLVPREERYNYVNKITEIPGFVYDANVKGSSIGGLKYDNVVFLLKPTGAQGRASAGTENEDIIVNEINKYIEEGAINIVFDSPDKSFTIKNVKEATTVGYDVAGGKKADIIIKADKNYPISIKKDNAGFWESSDTRYKAVVSKLSSKINNGDFAPNLTFKPFKDPLGNVKEGINIMFDERTNTKITGVIVTDLPKNEEESIIFGSDKSTVIYKTYTPKDFNLQGETLYIEVSKIIENMNDVKKYGLEPILNIRHDSTRTATGGLRATVQPKNKIYSDTGVTGNKIELSYNEIM
jgi:hypothetical protein